MLFCFIKVNMTCPVINPPVALSTTARIEGYTNDMLFIPESVSRHGSLQGLSQLSRAWHPAQHQWYRGHRGRLLFPLWSKSSSRGGWRTLVKSSCTLYAAAWSVGAGGIWTVSSWMIWSMRYWWKILIFCFCGRGMALLVGEHLLCLEPHCSQVVWLLCDGR